MLLDRFSSGNGGIFRMANEIVKSTTSGPPNGGECLQSIPQSVTMENSPLAGKLHADSRS
jgi:hypothetical protein